MWVWMSMSPRRDERAAGVDHVGGLIGEALAHRGHLTAVEGDVAPGRDLLGGIDQRPAADEQVPGRRHWASAPPSMTSSLPVT
jgi:hypothetical protein